MAETRKPTTRQFDRKCMHLAIEQARFCVSEPADDLGSDRAAREALKLRARQNVVFELGFFTAKLGRSRLAVLYEEGVEMPSDFSGILYISLDKVGAWKFKLAQELKRAGLQVDLNNAL